jgi:hypothetical protein
VGYQFYAVGADGHVCRSRTGIDGWRLSDWGQNDPDHALRDMTAGNVCVGGVCKFLWVIVGHDGAIYTSENPETDSWHLRFTDRAKSFERVVYGATAAGGMFVAHTGWNASQDIFYSSDGITWTKAELSKFNPVPGLSGFSSLQYVSAKNEFVVLNLTVDEYKEYRPVAFSSGDGKNWTTDIAQPPGDFDTLRFNDIVYDANINKWFVAVGMRKNGNVMDATSGRGQLADVFSAYGFLVPNSAFYSVDYDGKANYYIATWFKDPTYGSPKESGIASIGPNGQWLPVQMLGKCGGVPVLFSKPIIATDPAGNAHYIVTPNYSEGCAYWSDGGPSWFASPYSWK